MAAEGTAANAPTAGEYIIHHLTHLQNIGASYVFGGKDELDLVLQSVR